MMKTILFLLLLIKCSLTQEGGFCTTPLNEAGRCIVLPQCNSLVAAIKAQGYNSQLLNYLSRATCGYSGRTPLICCKESIQIATSTKPQLKTEPPQTAKPQIKTEPPQATTTMIKATTNSPANTISQSGEYLKPPQCGRTNDTNSRIVGGVPAKLGEFPWLVALGYRNKVNANMPKWLCGGSLISSKHILTAAHCVFNRPDLYVARLGDLDIYDDADGANPLTIPLIKAKVHEGYSGSTYTNDIAILTLKNAPDSPTIWPVCLPFEEIRSSKSDYTVAGWGAIRFQGPSSSLLQKAFLPEVTENACKNAFSNFRTIIDERVLCVGYLTGGIDTCQGDSGGPLMKLSEPNGQRIYYQFGIVSYGFKCAEVGYPGVYTRVTHFLEWIHEQIK